MGFFKQSEIKKRYDIGDTLGSGNFATVKRATSKQPTQGIPMDVAIKIIDKAKVDDMQDIRREVEIMQDIDHPGIIKLYEIFDEPKKMHLVMELVTGGELFDRIVAKGQYTEADASKAIRALSEALGYLHSKQIVHRDIKPENILCAGPEDAQLKIADFGLARVLSKGDMMKARPPACQPARPPARPRCSPHAPVAVPLARADGVRDAGVRGSRDPAQPGVRLGRGGHVVARRDPVHPALRLPALLRGGAARALRADHAGELAPVAVRLRFRA